MNLFPTPILLYHRIGPRDGSFMDGYTVSPDVFAAQMETLRCLGWRPIALERIVEPNHQGLNKRSLVITFDDGFASNKKYAFPILEKHAFPSATFLVTGCIGQSNRWDGPSRENYPLLSLADIATANRQLMTFHSHSVTHSRLNLTARDPKTLNQELTESLRFLEEIVDLPGRIFAYPFGNWNWRVVDAVRRAGYIGACTTMEGLNWLTTNKFLLRRIEITERDIGWRFRLKLRIGREILRWPPVRPPEILLALEWFRRKRAQKTFRIFMGELPCHSSRGA